MGREIRRVPAGWDHPRDEGGSYQPLLDESFRDAAQKWIAGLEAWRNGTHEDFAKWGVEYPYYWQWTGAPPDAEYYRPDWPEESRTHFQVYETVSEGTPISPVFATKEDVADWLVEQGHSREAAIAFCEYEYAPSFVFTRETGLIMGIDAAPFWAKGENQTAL